MRKRLVQTSRGPVEIEIMENRVHGLSVSVTPFAESGWQARPTKAWTSNQNEGESLSQFLARFASLPEPEAAQLAVDVQGPWREEWARSGGEAETRSLDRWVNVSVATVTVVVLLALVGLGLVIWLIVT
jgi:cobalamin biosynthesis Mg chelatase CobN